MSLSHEEGVNILYNDEMIENRMFGTLKFGWCDAV